MAFSDNVARLLEKNKVSNYRLAKDISVSRSTVRNWLDGKTAPQIEHARKVAAYFGKTVDEMMK